MRKSAVSLGGPYDEIKAVSQLAAVPPKIKWTQ